MTERELYEQDRDNRVNADMPELTYGQWKLWREAEKLVFFGGATNETL